MGNFQMEKLQLEFPISNLEGFKSVSSKTNNNNMKITCNTLFTFCANQFGFKKIVESLLFWSVSQSHRARVPNAQLFPELCAGQTLRSDS